MAATRAGDVWAEREDDALRRRLADALGEARALLGDPDGPDDPPALADAIARLSARLVPDVPAAAAQQEAHEQQLARIHSRYEDRIDALSRVDTAVPQLRAVTSPTSMLAGAARTLCECSDFDRVLISHVRDGTMVVGAAWYRDDEAGATGALATLGAEPIALEHPLVETEILRRRRATVVADAQTHPHVHPTLARVMRWNGYVAAPVAVRSRVIAVIHADRGPERPVDVLDRDILWEFATGLAQSYESATLRRRLRDERTQMREFLERLNTRSAQLNDAGIELMAQAPAGEADALDPAPREAQSGAMLAGLLTRRELEVLTLLSDGLSNRAIADELVVSEGTVKFHVTGVLRKLHVTNRAEAVARYLSLRSR